LFVTAYSKPAPTSQPPVLLLPQLLLKPLKVLKLPQVSDAPVVRLVMVRLLLPTQRDCQESCV